MKRHIKNIFKSNSGFTIIDALTGFTIFVIAVVPMFYLIRNYLLFSDDVKQKLKAYNLTVEALEILRNIRDSNYTVANQNWLTNLATSSCLDGSSNYCDVDYASSTKVFVFPTKISLKVDNMGGLSYQGSDNTDFYRRISYVALPDDPSFQNKISIKITVNFRQRIGVNVPSVFESEVFLYNFLSQ